MKNYSLLPFILLICWSCRKDAVQKAPSGNPPDTPKLVDYHKDITIVNWNIEWFGAAVFGGDLDVQEENAGKILDYLGADLYAICEVVDTARFGRMIRKSLNDEFAYIVSPYPQVDQKMVFVYNKHIFRKAAARAFMGVSTSAYHNFASGRFPFLFTADVSVNGRQHKVNFVLIHAKANADTTSYNRRLNGALELKDSLDTYFDTENTMVLGDFNDHLNGSILSGRPSPYTVFVNDSLKYRSLTRPLNTPGYQSTLGYANSVIDQQIVSGVMKHWYRSGSVRIRTDVAAVVPDFTTGNTSDHYPVSSVYYVN